MKKTIYRILGLKGRTTIPFVYRKILGIGYNDILSFTLDVDKIIVKREKICDNCQNRPLDEVELNEFFNSLSTEEKYHALTILSTKLSKERL